MIARLTRGQYFSIGLGLLVIKFVLDQWIASSYGHPWHVWNYWSPLGTAVGLLSATPPDRAFLFALTALSLPFVAAGVFCTLARLRDAGWPLWLVVLFFVPIVNLLFFLLLLAAPRPSFHEESEHAPFEAANRGTTLISIGLPAIGGALATHICTSSLNRYGFGLFIGLPFCIGFASACLYCLGAPRSLGSTLWVSTAAGCATGILLLAFPIEGAICLMMALPFALPLVLFGGVVGHGIQTPSRSHQSAAMLLFPLMFSPALTAVEAYLNPPAPLVSVRSSIQIAAPPETVWRNVVSFAELPPPREWIFHTGVAYPIRARIEGSGPGAIRKCEFSTGPFIEPIQVWDEPHLLRFSVTHNPAPLDEISPYGKIHPPHLDGFLVSRQGQFLLKQLPGGITELEGTTWYHHNLWPASYWQIWSDLIIHRIHMRVLDHIKVLSEGSPKS